MAVIGQCGQGSKVNSVGRRTLPRAQTMTEQYSHHRKKQVWKSTALQTADLGAHSTKGQLFCQGVRCVHRKRDLVGSFFLTSVEGTPTWADEIVKRCPHDNEDEDRGCNYLSNVFTLHCLSPGLLDIRRRYTFVFNPKRAEPVLRPIVLRQPQCAPHPCLQPSLRWPPL